MEISYRVKKNLITVIGNLITGSVFIVIVGIVMVFLSTVSFSIYKLIQVL